MVRGRLGTPALESRLSLWFGNAPGVLRHIQLRFLRSRLHTIFHILVAHCAYAHHPSGTSFCLHPIHWEHRFRCVVRRSTLVVAMRLTHAPAACSYVNLFCASLMRKCLLPAAVLKSLTGRGASCHVQLDSDRFALIPTGRDQCYLYGAQLRTTTRQFAQCYLIVAHFQHSKVSTVYIDITHGPFNVGKALLFVCMHGCAVACA